ncbi:MAG: toll/interleukin-1 receptor domain-containing protein [Gammaproteobacteria bacterium]|nr:toll/interleukin-1 receptor domain-containing protein [Gammaproteobacteria bacterium]
MKLFYSYCHADDSVRQDVERHLAPLRQSGSISEWYDGKIVPGQDLTPEIEANLADSDIIAFLLSASFLASNACQAELTRSLELRQAQGVTVLPIIVTTCAWRDDDRLKDILALPNNGHPLDLSSNRNTALHEIYEGVKRAVDARRLTIRPPFLENIRRTGFISKHRSDIRSDEIFVFPNLLRFDGDTESRIEEPEQVWQKRNRVLIRGEDQSGKTGLATHIFVRLSSQDQPVLYLTGDDIQSKRRHEQTIQASFGDQFAGEFASWFNRPNKTLIIDGLSDQTPLTFIDYAESVFDRILVTVSTDHYLAYYRDEPLVANYTHLEIRPLRHEQQEALITNWLRLGNGQAPDHHEVDKIENLVNSVILNRKIVPRYPFYVLTILQSSELRQGEGTEISAYGHCYHALITAQMARSGLHAHAFDSAFNYLTHLSFDMFRHRDVPYTADRYHAFHQGYLEEFVISDSLTNRLIAERTMFDRGHQEGALKFRYPYVYYFFLGRYFAHYYDDRRQEFDLIARRSFLEENKYILIFAIHHTRDEDLTDTVLIHTMEALDDVTPATLTKDEMRAFSGVVAEIPRAIATRSVEDSRRQIRAHRDRQEDMEDDDLAVDSHTEAEANDYRNEFYRLLKNMDILGQILRNKYGSFTRARLKDIVETITEAGLRLVSELVNPENVSGAEEYLVEVLRRDEKLDRTVGAEWEEHVRREARMLFFWAMCGTMHRTAITVAKPELREIVGDVCRSAATPAYLLLDFLVLLEASAMLRHSDVNHLEELLRTLDEDGSAAVRRLLSLATQHHLNAHDVDFKVRQRAYSALGLAYRPSRGKR